MHVFGYFYFTYTLIIMILPQILLRLNSKTNVLFDTLFLKDQNGNFLNFILVKDEEDYKKIKQYFLDRTGKNFR